LKECSFRAYYNACTGEISVGTRRAMHWLLVFHCITVYKQRPHPIHIYMSYIRFGHGGQFTHTQHTHTHARTHARTHAHAHIYIQHGTHTRRERASGWGRKGGVSLVQTCSKVSNTPLKACSKWFTIIATSKCEGNLNRWMRWFWLQTCSWYLALSRRRMAKSSKRTRSKGNSLPCAKRFDNAMADDDFEELQRGVSEVLRRISFGTILMVELLWWFLALADSLKNFTHFFVSAFVSLGAKPRCDSSKLSSTMVKSNRLVGGRLLPFLRERLVEDLAILRRLTVWTFSAWASTRNEHRC